MKFKDVAHLYVGCKVQWLREDDNTWQISDFTLSDAKWLLSKNCKPILYPLSAMTEEQKRYYTLDRYLLPIDFKYLLSEHFDLFNLHENNECYYQDENGNLY